MLKKRVLTCQSGGRRRDAVPSSCGVVCGVGNGGRSSSFPFQTRTHSITKKIVSRAEKSK